MIPGRALTTHPHCNCSFQSVAGRGRIAFPHCESLSTRARSGRIRCILPASARAQPGENPAGTQTPFPHCHCSLEPDVTTRAPTVNVKCTLSPTASCTIGAYVRVYVRARGCMRTCVRAARSARSRVPLWSRSACFDCERCSPHGFVGSTAIRELLEAEARHTVAWEDRPVGPSIGAVECTSRAMPPHRRDLSGSAAPRSGVTGAATARQRASP